ncbi:hypothetical protein GCM10011390_27360 [Aureimonas endophytica]|uniref:Uncharacterized protein n=1 Tax=Aureimonas endophytica TaxID=2027858 RepID=A0A916ZNU4_9HYPH|nr:hypothetical protein GCM10011390_27360 [Aureimonas endophytica]
MMLSGKNHIVITPFEDEAFAKAGVAHPPRRHRWPDALCLRPRIRSAAPYPFVPTLASRH